MLNVFLNGSKKGYLVKSYGTGSVVKLPGEGPNEPNIYSFGTTYEAMYQDLYQKNPHLYLIDQKFNYEAYNYSINLVTGVKLNGWQHG